MSDFDEWLKEISSGNSDKKFAMTGELFEQISFLIDVKVQLVPRPREQGSDLLTIIWTRSSKEARKPEDGSEGYYTEDLLWRYLGYTYPDEWESKSQFGQEELHCQFTLLDDVPSEIMERLAFSFNNGFPQEALMDNIKRESSAYPENDLKIRYGEKQVPIAIWIPPPNRD